MDRNTPRTGVRSGQPIHEVGKNPPRPQSSVSEDRRQKLIETLQRNLNSANRCMEELVRLESEQRAA